MVLTYDTLSGNETKKIIGLAVRKLLRFCSLTADPFLVGSRYKMADTNVEYPRIIQQALNEDGEIAYNEKTGDVKIKGRGWSAWTGIDADSGENVWFCACDTGRLKPWAVFQLIVGLGALNKG